MKKVSKGIVSVALSISTFACPLLYAAPVMASPRLYEVKQETTVSTRPNGIVTKIPAGQAYIPEGTELAVEVVDELSSKKNKTGEAVKLRLVDNIIINNVVVVPAGASVDGHITKSKGSGLFGRAGTLEFSVDSVRAVNNVSIPLQYVGHIQAGSDGGAVAVAAAVSLVGGLFMKGANVKVPAGTKVMAKVKTDTDLQTKIVDLAEAMNPNTPHGVSITLK